MISTRQNRILKSTKFLFNFFIIITLLLSQVHLASAQDVVTETPTEVVTEVPTEVPTDVPTITPELTETEVPTLEPTLTETVTPTPTETGTPTATLESTTVEFINPDLLSYLSADGNTLSIDPSPLIVYDNPDPASQNIRVPQPAEIQAAISGLATANISFSFTFAPAGADDPLDNGTRKCQTFPEAAKTAFNAAAAIWSLYLKSNVPVKVYACWANMGTSSGILGGSMAGGMMRNFPGAPQANVWYNFALANALAGTDLDTTEYDDYITYNSSFSWYYGTDGNTPAGQHDLVSVAAHELAHGLNFGGTASKDSSLGSYGWGSGVANIYDTFMESNSGTKLTSYTNPSTALGSLLTGGSLWFNGPNSKAANNGTRVKIYAPSTWEPGSSYSHLDMDTFDGTSNSLMVYAVGTGSSQHYPGDVTLGLFKDLGWPSVSLPGQPQLTGPSGTVKTLKPTLTWTPGSNTTSYIVKVNNVTLSSVSVNTTITASTYCTSTACSYTLPNALGNGMNYLWDITGVNSDGMGETSLPMGFITDIYLDPPTLLTPGTVANVRKPTYSWNEFSGATGYQLQVYDIDSSSTVINQAVATTACSAGICSVTPNTSLTHTNYYFMVATKNTYGLGDYTSPSVFKIGIIPTGVPTVVYPKGDIASGSVIFQWTGVADATAYVFKVTNIDVGGTTTVTFGSSCVSGTCTAGTNSVNFGGSRYSVIGAASNSYGQSAYSSPITFRVTPNLLTTPSLIGPSGNTANLLPTYQWNEVADVSEYLINVIKVSDSSAVIETTVNASACLEDVCSFTSDVELENFTSYQFQVQAKTDNHYSEPSTAMPFLTYTPPDPPLLLEPFGEISDNTPTFKWDETGPNLTGYRLKITNTGDNSEVLNKTYNRGTICDEICSVTLTAELLGQNYQFEVASLYNTFESEFSEPNAFYYTTHVKPETPVLTAPVGDIQVEKPAYHWVPVPGATSYQLRVTNLATSAVVVDQNVAYTACNDTLCSITPSTTLVGIQYQFEVQAKNIFGQSDYSEPTLFNISTHLPPAPPTLTAPAEAAQIRGTPTYSWVTPTGVNAFIFEYADNPEFNDPIYTSGVLTTASITPPTQNLGTYYWHVKSRNTYGDWGTEWSAARSVEIIPPLPAAPVLSAPATGSFTSNVTPELSWNEVPYAVRYSVQLSKSSSFNTLIDELEVESLSTEVTSDGDGLYYWRVSGINSNDEVGTWSASRTFSLDTEAPAVPKMTSPIKDLSVITVTPTFVVQAVTGAMTYEYEFDTTDLFESVFQSASATATSYVLPSEKSLPFGKLYYHVRAVDAAGNQSNWSESYSFIVTIQKTPVNGTSFTTITTAKPAFSWVTASEATGYRLQVATAGSNFDEPVLIDKTLGITTSYTLSEAEALAYGQYEWRMCVNKGAECGEGDWTPVLKFTVTPAPLSAPALLAPAASMVSNITEPIFTWNDVTNADGYEFIISKVSTFATFVQNETVTDPSFTVETLADGLFYWKVRTINYLGVPGAWSMVRSFTIDTVPPVAPSLISPADSSWMRGTPTYTWSAPATAKAYVFEYAETEDFSSPIYTSDELSTAKIIPPTQAAGTYFWHVKVRDTAGNWSGSLTPDDPTDDWSEARKITILTLLPSAPVLIAPAAGGYTNETAPELSWNATPYAVYYELQYSKVSTFATLLDDVYTDEDALSTTIITDGDGAYYWRLRGINSDGEIGPWSTTRSFILDTNLPATPVIISPLADSIQASVRPTFSIKAATGAKYYWFEVSDTPDDFSDPLLKVKGTSTKYTPKTTEELPFGTLYWRAIAEDLAGNLSDPTVDEGTEFVVTIQKTPANGSFTTSIKPGFTWSTVTGAQNYYLQVDTIPDFTSDPLVIDKNDLVSTSYTPTTPLTAGPTYYWRMAVKKGGSFGDWSPVFSFKVAAAAPAVPGLLTPAAGFLTNNDTPTFTWKPVTGAEAYDLQISSTSNFSTIVDSSLANVSTSYTASELEDGLHFWRVRSLNADGAPSAWSSARSFTIDTTAPDVPAIVSPAADVIVNTYLPKFTAGTVAGAKYYVFEVCADATCTTEVIRPNKQTTAANYTLTKTDALSIGDFYWHVKAIDTAGNSSDWSDPSLFYVTNQKTPAQNAVITTSTTTRPVFSWAALPGATDYTLHVYSDESLATEVYPPILLTTTKFTPTVAEALEHGKYYWVVSSEISGVPKDSTVYNFTVSPAAPAAPALNTPVTGGTTNNTTVELGWNAPSSGASSNEIQISASSSFSSASLIETAETVETSYTTVELLDGTYYWRVRSVNEFDVAGKWSSARNFIVDTAQPAAPVLSAPLNNAIVNTQTPTLAIKSVTGATSYLYEVDDDDAFGSVNVTGTSTKTSFVVPAGQKLDYGKYYWRVASIDKAGNQSNWSESEIRSFIVTNQKTPANGSYTTNARQPFTWVAVPGATGYEIQVCTDEECNPDAEVYTFTAASGTSYTPKTTETFIDGTYYWHMHVQVSGTWSDWTPILKFTKIH